MGLNCHNYTSTHMYLHPVLMYPLPVYAQCDHAAHTHQLLFQISTRSTH